MGLYLPSKAGFRPSSNMQLAGSYFLLRTILAILLTIVTDGYSSEARSDPTVILRAIKPFEFELTRSFAGKISSVDKAQVSVVACRSEFESVAIVVSAGADIGQLHVEVSHLTGKQGVLSSDNIGVKVVKEWFQGGSTGKSVVADKNRVLVSELLLHDDALIQVDQRAHSNYLKLVSGERVNVSEDTYRSHPIMPSIKAFPVQDAASLLPFSMARGESKRLWITVKVPDDAIPGVYRGLIRMSSKSQTVGQIPLTVTVLPFELQQPRIVYSIYYRGQLRDKSPTVSSEFKSSGQMRAELKDMLEHGISNPTVYQGFTTDTTLYWVLKMRQSVGFDNGTIFYLGFNTGIPNDSKGLAELGHKVAGVVNVSKGMGARDIYFYGVEEVRGEQLFAQYNAWNKVHEYGGKVFMAGYDGTFETVGDKLDLLVAKDLDRELAAKVHEKSRKIFIHKPQGGDEEPNKYRKQYGISLWASGYDGAMPYAYQHGMGDAWNDFDHPKFRDHNFTYPTIDGVIDTIEWEGFREGVDDVKYLTTLESMIEVNAKNDQSVARARRFLDELRSKTVFDPVMVRCDAIKLIRDLKGTWPPEVVREVDIKCAAPDNSGR